MVVRITYLMVVVEYIIFVRLLKCNGIGNGYWKGVKQNIYNGHIRL
jgi:hypothetical protein